MSFPSRLSKGAREARREFFFSISPSRLSKAARVARREKILLSTALPPGEVSLGFVRHSNFLLVLYIRELECGARSAP